MSFSGTETYAADMIGILGGTFDRIHNGHLHIANQVVERLNLEQLQFLPCAIQVHRNLPHASSAHRCATIELITKESAIFALNCLEIDRNEPSYTVDTLRQMHRAGSSSLTLVLGVDAFNRFASWKSPEEILRLANLVVCRRPGYDADQDLYRQHRVTTTDEFEASGAGAILMLEVDAPYCSSSSVRAALDTGKIPESSLPPAVADYIDQHDLYRKPGD